MIGVLLLSTAITALAGPVTATRDGWITLPEFDALGEIVWTADVGTSFGLFHDPVSNHDSTWTEEQFSYTVNAVDGRIYLHLFAASLNPRCGRWQFDVGNPELNGKSLGIESWNCGSEPPSNPPNEPPFFPPDVPEPPSEPPTSVPESTSLLLLAGGLWWMARRKRS